MPMVLQCVSQQDSFLLPLFIVNQGFILFEHAAIII